MTLGPPFSHREIPVLQFDLREIWIENCCQTFNIILSPPRYFHESPTTAESSFLIKKPSISLRVASSSTVSVSWIHYDDDVKDVKEDSALDCKLNDRNPCVQQDLIRTER